MADTPPSKARPGSAPQPIGEIIRENVFTPYRDRVLYPAAAIGALVVLPLAILHFVRGHLAIALLSFVAVAFLGIDVAALSRGRRPPIPFVVLILPAAGAIAVSLAQHGIAAALWAYPMVTFGYFVLARGVANVVGLSMLALGTTLLFLYHDTGLAVRFLVSLGFVIGTTNVLIEVLESVHARLLEQSVADVPTGAYNRRHLETCVGHVIERFERTGETAALLAIDFDRFAKVNDRFGVEGGDRVLRAFAELARKRLRAQDLVFRTGGEQFAVLLADTRLEAAVAIGEELRRLVEREELAEGHPVTVSIGVSELRAGDSYARWLKRATLALRSSKDEGRNRVTSEVAPEAA